MRVRTSGSAIQCEHLGTLDAVMGSHLVLIVLPVAHAKDRLAAVAISDGLERHLAESAVDEFDGFGTARDSFEVFLYTDDADRLLDEVRPLLTELGMPKGTTVQKRYGPPGSASSTLGGLDLRVEIGSDPGSRPTGEYQLGDWVAVPTHDGRYALARILARGSYGDLVLAVMGPGFTSVPDKPGRSAAEPELIAHRICGDEGIRDGHWPVLGGSDEFLEEEWPLPVFERGASANHQIIFIDRNLRRRAGRKLRDEEVGQRPSAGIRNQFGMEAEAGRLLDVYESGRA